MVTKMGPSYANLFVGFIEHKIFNQSNGPKPKLYGRYIDNCIGASSSSKAEIDRFIASVNSFHSALKYTREISETSFAFLDIKISNNGSSLSTSVHYKPTDSHSSKYLLHSSSHPVHVKKALPYSQFLRLGRLCSHNSDYSSRATEMCQLFEKRGYPGCATQEGFLRAQEIDRESALQTSPAEKNPIHPYFSPQQSCCQKHHPQEF